jgi:hypothetical protein
VGPVATAACSFYRLPLARGGVSRNASKFHKVLGDEDPAGEVRGGHARRQISKIYAGQFSLLRSRDHQATSSSPSCGRGRKCRQCKKVTPFRCQDLDCEHDFHCAASAM